MVFDTATLNRAARVLRSVSPELPADAALRRELAAQRALSGAAKQAVVRAVFAYFRWRGWLEPKDSVQRQLDAALTLQRRFDARPESFKAETLAARAVPAWLRDEMDLPPETLRVWQQEPVLWLRARPGTAAALARELGHCREPAALPAFPHPWSALQYEGVTDLYRTDAFQRGAFEIQDLASQWVGHACAPQAGETWWDACAGEGGKTLHLSELMENKGLIWASDRSLRRLETLRQRCARASRFNVRTARWEGGERLPTRTRFDGVLVDAPCSGVGTWQRNPHARWTTRVEDVAELADIQARLLTHAATAVKPGGRLVYAVCTLTRRETSGVADAFTAAHPDFVPEVSWPGRPAGIVTLWPHEWRSNGMAVAVWRRR